MQNIDERVEREHKVSMRKTLRKHQLRQHGAAILFLSIIGLMTFVLLVQGFVGITTYLLAG